MNNKIEIEVQYFNDCPNSAEMIRRIKEAINGNEEEIEYREILVKDNDHAEKVKFRGSPTLLINGNDIEGLPEPEKPAMMCRYYSNGLPEIQNIKETIQDRFKK